MKKPIYDTTRGSLLAVELPETTRTYKCVPHEQLIGLTYNSIVKAGFSIERESYRQAKEGNVAGGEYLIKDVTDNEMQLLLTWCNSYDKSLSLAFGIGAWMKICGNGMMGWRTVGELRRKHTGEIQEIVPISIPEYIKGAGEIFMSLQKDREAMKDIILTKRITAELLGRAYLEEQFISSTQLNLIKDEISHPTHFYGDPNSLWTLYNYTTFALKNDHPSTWMSDHIDAHKFFCDVAGLIIPKKEPIQLTLYDEYEKAEILELEDQK